jgi:hypothetical protein
MTNIAFQTDGPLRRRLEVGKFAPKWACLFFCRLRKRRQVAAVQKRAGLHRCVPGGPQDRMLDGRTGREQPSEVRIDHAP